MYDETFMLLSPRQLALAIGMSESSLKRWADAGKLTVSRTEGGHRRIAVGEAVRFIRDSGATVVRPDLLGLGTRGKRRTRAGRGAGAARAGDIVTDASAARSTLVARFLGGESIAALADGVIADAIARIEELYERGERETKSELAARAATDAWMQAIAAVRGMCEIGNGAPVAVGGARGTEDGERGTGDGERVADGNRSAALRSAVVAAVLAGEGLRVIDLGAGVTNAVMRAAVAAHRPAITWIVDEAIDLGGYRVRTMAEVAAFARGLNAR